MRSNRLPGLSTVLTLAILVLLPLTATAQGTVADYRRAMSLEERWENLAVNVPGPSDWIGETHRFWYRTSVTGGHEFVVMNADSLERRPAFDHERLATALSAATGDEYTALTLPFNRIEFSDDETSIEVSVGRAPYRCGLADYTCERIERAGPGRGRGRDADDDEPRPSPDGRWEALIHNYNVAVREVGSEDLVHLGFDGSEGNAYELSSIQWSPDSTKLAAYRVKPGYRREVHYVESSPEDQLQPKHSTLVYAKPGDVLDLQQPVIFHVDVGAPSASNDLGDDAAVGKSSSGKQLSVDNALFPNPYRLSRLEWREDSSAVTFEYNQRGHQVYRVIEVDSDTGEARAVISEEPETFFTYSSKRFRHDVGDGAEVIWMSERDGWNHLWLYDGVTGEVKNQITRGEWVVRDVVEVDEESRQIWFAASGMHGGQDPYLLHYYRIGFDGSGLTALTEVAANHDVSFSADMHYYIDTYSRVDMAPVAELHRTADRTLVAEIGRGDIGALTAAGWQPPEVFTAKGRDAETDIWGIIVRPTDFDPARRYPVIEYIYAGPHSSHVPKSFSVWSQMRAQAELGFIVVQIDGMGTSNRSKAFHDFAWRDLKDAGFPDRILWHRAVAARYPWYDVSRVGIYGTSAGGQNSLGALLFHGDFYKAAVSAAGCHDNRMDKIWWNEQWMGWPIGPHYAASSNVDNAWRLEGDLLLVVGEMDTNVDPSSTMQVVNALIEANKPFDLLVIPGAGHTSGGEYGEHKRFDFFVERLLGVTPPSWADLEAATTTDAGSR